ncbi:hypothetical protein [Legionella waltersii]|uniref:Uncharacterized protein n=1 Tax=Legionella waltersii TaxID=66969 RepID=A0A0W1AN10_9GAMM|nr:hypothetical protein [Legionella waltersii]KTD82717.1 hypothetical protein Lwal_0459 [Legionella waltersii]SNV03433.1 Uncharacterised protein [Legionella waltersii]
MIWSGKDKKSKPKTNTDYQNELKSFLSTHFYKLPEGVFQIDTPGFDREKSKLLLNNHKELPFVIRNSSKTGCYCVDYLNSKGEIMRWSSKLTHPVKQLS